MTEESAPVLYCVYHPSRETLLRCNKCGQPICTDCARLTEVGYRCKVCVRNQRQVYYNSRAYDLPIAAVVGFVLGGITALLALLFLGRLGFIGFYISIFAGPAAGGIIAEAIRWSTGKRRAQYRNVVSAGATAAGMLLVALFFGFGALMGLLPVLIFAVLAIGTVYARLP